MIKEQIKLLRKKNDILINALDLVSRLKMDTRSSVKVLGA